MPHRSGQQIAAWSPATTPTDRRAVDGGHDGLRALDDVADEVARLPQHACPHRVVVHDLVDQLERSAGREGPAGAAQQRDTSLGIAIDREPDVGQLAVDVRSHRVEARPVHRDAQHAVGGPVERQARVGLVAVDHGLSRHAAAGR
jgi:hypothetical protein